MIKFFHQKKLDPLPYIFSIQNILGDLLNGKLIVHFKHISPSSSTIMAEMFYKPAYNIAYSSIFNTANK